MSPRAGHRDASVRRCLLRAGIPITVMATSTKWQALMGSLISSHSACAVKSGEWHLFRALRLPGNDGATQRLNATPCPESLPRQGGDEFPASDAITEEPPDTKRIPGPAVCSPAICPPAQRAPRVSGARAGHNNPSPGL
ncbi:hypothetical protein SKAU_G00125380 [Synaphobranchus kaupii]|uniref:Uncharacterized protein n=1 Tax=Synaphobranchus kaupii TaxID=118154 RepID=A0A9Q1J0P2_SYNKA|nr:hypothetical protein SKAU_G00125380 [Synaphobranchus kaupii]